MSRNGAFHSYCQKTPKQCLEMGPCTVTVRKYLNWGFPQLLSENASKIPRTEAFLSYCQKCLNNASKWGLPQLLSENTSTMPQTGAFLSYCQKMPQQCLELRPSSVTVRKCLNYASN
jgi:hypothetical protein